MDKETKIELEAALLEKLKNTYQTESIFISAHKKENIDVFREKLTELIKQQYVIQYPYMARRW